MNDLMFGREKKRMCEFYVICADCPAAKENCGDVLRLEPLIPIVEKWSAEHPLVRNVDWVAEQLEKIGYKVNKERFTHYCPVQYSSTFDGESHCSNKQCSECQKWWLEEHREEKKE